MDRTILYTTGYEGNTIHDFISKLQENNIQVVIDVREIPISRKKGFSKTVLKDLLHSNEIDYIHYKQLGSPKEIRYQLHEDGNFFVFRNHYLNYLKTRTEELEEIKTIVESENSCLLCFEKNARLCHRSIVADILYSTSENIVKVVDL